MAFVVADRVKETTVTTGTVTYVLGGAAQGYRAFTSVASNADIVYYAVTLEDEWEVGVGTYTLVNTVSSIVRTTILSSSNSNAAVNWGAGTKDIFLTYPAEGAVVADQNNLVTIDGSFTHITSSGTQTHNVSIPGNIVLSNASSSGSVDITSNSDSGARLNLNGGSNQTILSAGTVASPGTVDVIGNVNFFNNIAFEGSTLNAFETTITATDPTADRTITLPDADGTVTLVNSSGDLAVSGDISVTGTVDGIDIATRDAVLTATTTTANAALPKAGGTMTGQLTMDTEDISFSTGGKLYFNTRSTIHADASTLYVGDGGFVTAKALHLQSASPKIQVPNQTNAAWVNVFETDGFGGVISHNGFNRVTALSTGASIGGDLTLTGTVDGRDIAANIPATLTNNAGKYLKVSAGEAATEWATLPASLAAVVDDTSPQLGGDLDVNGQKITSASNANIVIEPNGSGDVVLETDRTTIQNTSDSTAGPFLILEHITASPSAADTHGLIAVGTTDAGGNAITPFNLYVQTPDVTSGAATGKAVILIKEDGAAPAYLTLDGDAEKVILGKNTDVTGDISVTGTVDGIDIATRDAVLTATTTTANNALPKAGGAMTGAITTNSTFDGVDVATRDAVLTATTTTANAALPKAGGTMTGQLTMDTEDISFSTGGKLYFNTRSTIHADASTLYVGDDGFLVAKALHLQSASPKIQVPNQTNASWVNVFETDGFGGVISHNGFNRVTALSTGASIGGDLTLTGTVDGVDIATRDAILTSTTTTAGTANTTANNALPKAGGAMTGAITTNSTFDGVDVATRDAILTSTTTTAGNALPKAGGTMTGAIAMGTSKVTGLGDPTAAQDAATKTYVDSIAAAGVSYHEPARVATTGNLTASYDNGLSGVAATLTNSGTQAALVVDGITIVQFDRILVDQQTNAAHNGVYIANAIGSGSSNWTLMRSLDTDSYENVGSTGLGQGSAFFVSEGNTEAGHLRVCNVAGTITFGTTAITFALAADTTIYSAGTGVTLTGTSFSIGQAVATNSTPTFGSTTIGGNLAVTGTVDGVDIAARNVVLTSTTTTANAALPKAGGAMTGAITTNSTFDGVDIATRDAVLTSTTTTANAALPKAGGAMTGAITTNSTFDGRDVGTDGTKLDGIAVNATNVTNNNQITNGAGYTTFTANQALSTTNSPQFASLKITDDLGGFHAALSSVSGDLKLQSNDDLTLSCSGNIAMTLNQASGSMQNITSYTHFIPSANGTRDLGTSGANWRNLYVSGTVDGVDISTRDAVLTATTTTANNALPKAGGAMTGAITTNSTFDGVDVATRDAVLTSTTTTANNALPKAGGAMTGAITTNSTFDGRDVGTDGTKLDTIATNANYITNNTQLTNGAGYTTFTANQALSTTSSPQFASLKITDDLGGFHAALSSVSGDLKLQSNDDLTLSVSGNTAMTLNQSGGGMQNITSYTHFIPNGARDLGSLSANWRNIYVSGTVDGRNVSTDGTKLDTIATSANNYTLPFSYSTSEGNNTVAQRNGSGYLHASYFNGTGTFATSGAASGMGRFTGTNGSDTYGRSYTNAAARTLLNVADGANNYTLPAGPARIGTPSGEYGSVKVTTATGGYSGYAINDDWVFMSSGASISGIYNDTDNEWGTIWRQNGGTELYHNGLLMLETIAAAGIRVGGVSNHSDIYMADANEGERRIHCNSNRIGFLNSSNNWGAYCPDAGGWDVAGNLAVTGTVDGRDVATDGTKLDGIQASANYITNNNQLTNGAGYTNDQTAAEILTKIKTVDGAGSGLDADLLDGYDNTKFFQGRGSTITTTTNVFQTITQGTASTGYCEMHIGNNSSQTMVMGSIGSGYTGADWAGSRYIYTTAGDLRLKATGNLILHSGGTANANIACTFDTSKNAAFGGNITLSGTVDGRDVAADGTKLNTIATNANYITNNNQLTNGAGYTNNTVANAALPKAGGTCTGAVNLQAGGSHKGNHEFAATGTGTGYSDAAIELRESNYSSASGTAPHIGFHWGGVVASNIAIESSGAIAIRNNPGNAYEALRCAALDVAGNLAVTGTVDGRDVAADGTKLNTIATNANYITNNNQLTNGAGYTTFTANQALSTSSTAQFALLGVGGAHSGASNVKQTINHGTAGFLEFKTTSSIGFSGFVFANGGGSGGSFIYTGSGGTDNATLTVQGTAAHVFTATNLSSPQFTATSDIKLKENIKVIDDPLEKLSKISGYNFDWKETGKKSAGVIAQEIEEIMPELITETNHTKSVNYNGLIGLLIETVKAQQVQIDDLNKRVKA